MKFKNELLKRREKHSFKKCKIPLFPQENQGSEEGEKFVRLHILSEKF